MIGLIRTPTQDKRGPSSQTIRTDIVEGLRFVWQRPFFRGLAISVALANLSLGAASSILVLFAIEELGAAEAEYGLMVGIGALGGVTAALVASRIIGSVGHRWAMSGGIAVLGLGQLVPGLSSVLVAAVAGMVIALFGVTLFNVAGRTLRQALTPDRLLGRVVASFRLIGIGALPIGALFGGWIASVAGLRAPYLIGAVLIVVAAVRIHRVSTEERIGE